MGLYVQEVASFKLNKRNEAPTLYWMIGGDIGQGDIHPGPDTYPLVVQIHGALHIFTHAIDYLLNFYKNIEIFTVTDNHWRMPHVSKRPQTAQKWNSFATLFHISLKMAYRNDKRVKVYIPKTPYATFKVFDHTYWLTHGDTVIKTGNVGKTVDISSLNEQLNNLNTGNTLESPIDVALFGHVHVPLNTTLPNGCELIINGTGSGVDPYAQSIGIFYNNPTQVIWEATPQWAVGDFRKVSLRPADDKKEYDKIIPPYEIDSLGPGSF